MKFSRTVAKYGAQAVLQYCKIAGIKEDNRVPEIFLGSWIARGLSEELGVNAHVERHYTIMAGELGVEVDAELITAMGLWRADVAVYENGKPVAIIEIKIYDERRNLESIIGDLQAMHDLSRRVQIDTYLAILITDTARSECVERMDALSQKLGQPFDAISQLHRANNGMANWKWLFACGAFPISK
jgi:hypothetical protein